MTTPYNPFENAIDAAIQRKIDEGDGYSLWDGTYIKGPYYALINGKQVACWPNAGSMMSTDGSGRVWQKEDNILVKQAEDFHAWIHANDKPQARKTTRAQRRRRGK